MMLTPLRAETLDVQPLTTKISFGPIARYSLTSADPHSERYTLMIASGIDIGFVPTSPLSHSSHQHYYY